MRWTRFLSKSSAARAAFSDSEILGFAASAGDRALPLADEATKGRWLFSYSPEVCGLDMRSF